MGRRSETSGQADSNVVLMEGIALSVFRIRYMKFLGFNLYTLRP